MCAKSLSDLPRGVVLQRIATQLALLGTVFLLFIFSFVSSFVACSAVPVCSSRESPQPHRCEACVFFKPGGIRPFKNHVERFFSDSSPDVFQVFLERDLLPAGLFNAGIAREDL